MNLNPRYKRGQIVKFDTTLRSGKNEQVFGKITNLFYDKEYNCYRYNVVEYPEEGELKWIVPEHELDCVSLMDV